MLQPIVKKNPNTKPKAAIIIVTYNGAAFIERCLLSLQKQTYPKDSFSITIVDNTSTDNTPEIVEKNLKNASNITLIKNKKNSGFGAGNNIGIKSVHDVDYVVLLNQDTWVEKDWLEQLVNTMEKNPQAGCCGAAEHPYDTTLPIPREKRASTKAGCWMGGGSTIFRKEALNKTGLFDEIYFMYSEDMDLTWRIQLAGYTIIQNNNAIWHHHGRKRNDQTTGWRVYYAWRNRLFLLLKFGSARQMSSSVWKYFLYLVLGKRKGIERMTDEKREKENREEEVKNEPLLNWKIIPRKLLFSTKLCCAILYYFPQLLQRRGLMKKQGIEYKRTDTWIRETDRQLYGI